MTEYEKYISESCYATLDEDCEKGRERAMIIRNMRNYLAKRNSTIIWGNGYILESDDEKMSDFFNKYQRDNRLLELFFWLEETISKYGRAIITINKTKDGEYKLNVPDSRFLNVVAKSFYTEDLAVVWQRVVQDTTHWFIKSTYDKFKVVNEIYYKQQGGTLQAYDKNIPLPKEAQVPREWIHNFGFVPVVEIANFPNKEWDPNFIMWNRQTDWYNSIAFESLFIQAYNDFKIELALCHSRIGIENGTQQMIQDLQRQLTDWDGERDVLNNIIFSTPAGSKIVVQKGVSDFQSYTNALEFIMDFYCKFSNSSRFSEGGGAQKTTQEVKINRSAQIEAITTKISLRELKYSELLAKLFACYGLMKYDEQKWPFSFKVNGNIQKEETVFLDNIIKQVNLGTMSMVEAISKLRNLPKQRAEEIFNEIKDFNEDNEIMTSIMGGDLDFELGESGKVGRPPDVVETDKESK